MTSLTVGKSGEIAIPSAMRERYHLVPDSPVRIIETRSGILIVPLTGERMSPALEREIIDWQSVSADSWDAFPYEDS